eukprot:COSAG02_NODE_3173_length_7227_cov_35.536336_7_plen_360_part_00
MGKKNKKDSAAKAKKEARKLEQAKLAEQGRLLKEARESDPLEKLPAAFLAFKRGGVDAVFEHATIGTLSTEDRLAVRAILEGNVESDSELKVEKAKLTEENTHLLLLRATPVGSPASSPMKSPTKDEAADVATEDADCAVGAAKTETDAPTTPTKITSAAGPSPVLAYLNFRFEFQHETLMCAISELQVANREDVRRKGIGKFMLMLAEMCAKNAGMSGVMATVRRANSDGMAFFESCKYTTDNISPCKMDPSADAGAYGVHLPDVATQIALLVCEAALRCPNSQELSAAVVVFLTDHEIYSKVWDADARAVIDKKAEVLRSSNSVEGKARAAMKAEKDAAAAAVDGVRSEMGQNRFQM